MTAPRTTYMITTPTPTMHAAPNGHRAALKKLVATRPALGGSETLLKKFVTTRPAIEMLRALAAADEAKSTLIAEKRAA